MSRQPRFCATYLRSDGSHGEVWGVVFGYPDDWSDRSIQERREWYCRVAGAWGLPQDARLTGFELHQRSETSMIPSSETADRFTALLDAARSTAEPSRRQ
ncbi:MAG: hypothetical protein RL885_31915 [Planctomycetota bacterium]